MQDSDKKIISSLVKQDEIMSKILQAKNNEEITNLFNDLNFLDELDEIKSNNHQLLFECSISNYVKADEIIAWLRTKNNDSVLVKQEKYHLIKTKLLSFQASNLTDNLKDKTLYSSNVIFQNVYYKLNKKQVDLYVLALNEKQIIIVAKSLLANLNYLFYWIVYDKNLTFINNLSKEYEINKIYDARNWFSNLNENEGYYNLVTKQIFIQLQEQKFSFLDKNEFKQAINTFEISFWKDLDYVIMLNLNQRFLDLSNSSIFIKQQWQRFLQWFFNNPQDSLMNLNGSFEELADNYNALSLNQRQEIDYKFLENSGIAMNYLFDSASVLKSLVSIEMQKNLDFYNQQIDKMNFYEKRVYIKSEEKVIAYFKANEKILSNVDYKEKYDWHLVVQEERKVDETYLKKNPSSQIVDESVVDTKQNISTQEQNMILDAYEIFKEYDRLKEIAKQNKKRMIKVICDTIAKKLKENYSALNNKYVATKNNPLYLLYNYKEFDKVRKFYEEFYQTAISNKTYYYQLYNFDKKEISDGCLNLYYELIHKQVELYQTWTYLVIEQEIKQTKMLMNEIKYELSEIKIDETKDDELNELELSKE